MEVRRENFLELEACVAEMALDRAFRTVQTSCYGFDREFLVVIQHEHKTTGLREAVEGVFQVFPQLLAEDVLTRASGGVCDTVFLDEMQRLGVAVFLSTEIIYTDVFGNTIQPRGEGGGGSEAFDGAKCFQPGLLGQVFGEFGVFDSTADVGIQVVMVFANQETERFRLSLLGAFDEMFFGTIKQCCVFLSFDQGCCVEF